MGSEQAVVQAGEPARHRITVDEFLALDDAGFFDNHRVELIDGEIYEMSPLHLGHGWVAGELSVDLGNAVRALRSSLRMTTPVSARLDAHNLPEADILVVDVANFSGDVVTRDIVRLLVEVASTSLKHDLGPKLRLYARTGVPEYWVADVNAREIIRFHAPAGEAYAERATFAFGEPIPSATIPGLTVDTSRLA